MAIYDGRLTVRRYTIRTETSPPSGEELHTLLVERLGEFAFRGLISHDEQAIGWVRPDNPLETDFADDLNVWQIGPWVRFVMRIDKRTVPPKILAAHLNRAAKEWCDEHGRERCPAAVRRELRDEIKQELIGRQTPKIKLVETAWNTDTNIVLCSTLSVGVNDEFRKLFFRTFGLRLESQMPSTWIDREHLGEALNLACADTPGPHFLLWLWWVIRSAPQHLDDLSISDAWVDDHVRLEAGDGKTAAVLDGEDAVATAEAYAALRAGKLPTSLKLGMQIGERPYDYELTLKAPMLDVTSAALSVAPDPDEGEPGTFLLRMHAYAELHNRVRSLFCRWARIRLDSTRWASHSGQMRIWMAHGAATATPVP